MEKINTLTNKSLENNVYLTPIYLSVMDQITCFSFIVMHAKDLKDFYKIILNFLAISCQL